MLVGPAGFEPATYGLKVRSSTVELEAQGARMTVGDSSASVLLAGTLRDWGALEGPRLTPPCGVTWRAAAACQSAVVGFPRSRWTSHPRVRAWPPRRPPRGPERGPRSRVGLRRAGVARAASPTPSRCGKATSNVGALVANQPATPIDLRSGHSLGSSSQQTVDLGPGRNILSRDAHRLPATVATLPVATQPARRFRSHYPLGVTPPAARVPTPSAARRAS
jgi:hypothetical protein